MRRLGIVTTLLLLALTVAAAAKPVTVTFRTGTYSAKTSNGSRFKFKIEAHTATVLATHATAAPFVGRRIASSTHPLGETTREV
jgi:hypothetical protein